MHPRTSLALPSLPLDTNDFHLFVAAVSSIRCDSASVGDTSGMSISGDLSRPEHALNPHAQQASDVRRLASCVPALERLRVFDVGALGSLHFRNL
jgi:hypothetical protein